MCTCCFFDLLYWPLVGGRHLSSGELIKKNALLALFWWLKANVLVWLYYISSRAILPQLMHLAKTFMAINIGCSLPIVLFLKIVSALGKCDFDHFCHKNISLQFGHFSTLILSEWLSQWFFFKTRFLPTWKNNWNVVRINRPETLSWTRSLESLFCFPLSIFINNSLDKEQLTESLYRTEDRKANKIKQKICFSRSNFEYQYIFQVLKYTLCSFPKGSSVA